MSAGVSSWLAAANASLGWPPSKEIMEPTGAPARALTSLAQDKFRSALVGSDDLDGAKIGVLLPASDASETDTPIALVIDLPGAMSDSTARALQKLAWNFSQSPALITIEPGLVRVWSCCIVPDEKGSLSRYLVHEVGPPDLIEIALPIVERRAAAALHWVNLVSGRFFQDRSIMFNRNGRADQSLLDNLRQARAALISAGLHDEDVCHDLLARIIFIQFLFDRKDPTGTAALSDAKLHELHMSGILAVLHRDLAGVLRHYEDAYALFEWLNRRFNGDLFPGKGSTDAEREAGWRRERDAVAEVHLEILADFVGGSLQMTEGQGCLWRQYSFDVIPLEFISSIYESFVAHRDDESGVYYTPPALVDFVLDLVLPWGGQDWNLVIVDPSCGSGVFLVKAFQRLVFRWKEANPGMAVPIEVLTKLLESNLFGIDKDPHAVRVACFSLYLAMCDEIDPREYWNRVRFPEMRGVRLVASDLFDPALFNSPPVHWGSRFDLIVGNAPWGRDTVTDHAREWAAKADPGWPVANNDIGTLFLPKAAEMLADNGRIALIQPAAALLFNKGASATEFRRMLFTSYRVNKVINLSAIRFKLFGRKNTAAGKKQGPVAPACIVVMSAAPAAPDDEIMYISPKSTGEGGDASRIVILASDARRITARDAAADADVWPALMWGTSRDLFLLRRLREAPTLANPGGSRSVISREGIIFGDKRKSPNLPTEAKLFKADSFPPDSLFTLIAENVPEAGAIKTHSRDSTDFSAFAAPQLLVKQAFRLGQGRFQARVVRTSRGETVLASQSYVSVHDPSGSTELLDAACLAFNSKVAAYFLFLTSGRFASYRPEVLAEELLEVPLPPSAPNLLDGVDTLDELDSRMFKALRLKPAEIVLIEDLMTYILPDAKTPNGPGLKRTTRELKHSVEPELKAYCEHFTRVLKAGSGERVSATATIFQNPLGDSLPFRLVAFELGRPGCSKAPEVRRITTGQLLEQLRLVAREPGTFSQRVIRLYDTVEGAATVFMIKPDEVRHWTRSSGLIDADAVSVDLVRWYQDGVRFERGTAA